MLLFHLPPNFAAAAARDAVPLRVELDLTVAPGAELLPALALLQGWCGAGAPPKFIQLSRAQLRKLAAAADSAPLFVEAGKIVAWRHDALVAETEAPSNGGGNRHAAMASKPASRTAVPPLVIDGSEHFLALTLPSREHPDYAAALALVKDNGFILEPSNRKWWLRDRHKVLNFLATHGARLRESRGAQFTSNFERNTTHLRTAEIVTTVAPAGEDFSVTLALQAGSADEPTVRSAVAANRGYLEADGKIFLLDAARLEKITAAQRRLAGDPAAALTPRRTQRISAARTAEAQAILEELSPGFQPPESWRVRSAALRELTALAPAPVPAGLDAMLRPYQRLGAAWLWHLHRHQLGGILADEMGWAKLSRPSRSSRRLTPGLRPATPRTPE